MMSTNIHFIRGLKHPHIGQFKNIVAVSYVNGHLFKVEQHMENMFIIGKTNVNGESMDLHPFDYRGYIGVIEYLNSPTIFFIGWEDNADCSIYAKLKIIHKYIKYESIIIIDHFNTMNSEHRNNVTFQGILKTLCSKIKMVYILPSEQSPHDRLVIHLDPSVDSSTDQPIVDAMNSDCLSDNSVSDTLDNTTSNVLDNTTSNVLDKVGNIVDDVSINNITDDVSANNSFITNISHVGVVNNIDDINGNIYVNMDNDFTHNMYLFITSFALGQKNNMTVYVKDISYLQFETFKHMNTATGNVLKNGDYIIDGYWESYTHADAHIPTIKNILTTNNSSYERMKKYYSFISHGQLCTIALHVNQAYRSNISGKIYTVHPDQYYNNSLGKILSCIPQPYIILVFSDDENYVKDWIVLNGHSHFIVHQNTEDAWWLMTMCDHFIVGTHPFGYSAYMFRDHQQAQLCIPDEHM